MTTWGELCSDQREDAIVIKRRRIVVTKKKEKLAVTKERRDCSDHVEGGAVVTKEEKDLKGE